MKRVIALVVALVMMLALSVSLLSCGDDHAPIGSGGRGSSSSLGTGYKPGNNKNDKPTSSTTSTKTNISLPSATENKSYLPTLADNFSDVTNDEEIKSSAIILVDVTDNKVIAGANIDTKVYPASMTKVMTLLVAVENMSSLDQKATVTKQTKNYDNEQNKTKLSGRMQW